MQFRAARGEEQVLERCGDEQEAALVKTRDDIASFWFELARVWPNAMNVTQKKTNGISEPHQANWNA